MTLEFFPVVLFKLLLKKEIFYKIKFYAQEMYKFHIFHFKFLDNIINMLRDQILCICESYFKILSFG